LRRRGWGVFNRDLAVVAVDEVGGDGQAEAGAAMMAGSGFVGVAELKRV
jgi:hypothetical protein